MFDSAITRVRHHLGINTLDDWKTIKPEWILKMDGIGPATLDHIRIHLANRNVTLLDDETPEFWKAKKGVRVGQALSYDDLTIQVPFTIIIDTREQLPFLFNHLTPHASDIPNDIKAMIKIGEIEESEVKLSVPTKFKSLGNFMGDYSIAGHQGFCNIERKSIQDIQSTLLGWNGGRDRFQVELENLAAMDTAAVVIEGSLGQVLATVKQRGKKTARMNRRILQTTICSWRQKYRVPWYFCDYFPNHENPRWFAETTAFTIFKQYWKRQSSNSPQVLPPETLEGINEI